MSSVYASADFRRVGTKLAEYTLESLDAAVVMFDRCARATQWNAAAPSLLGVDDQQMAGQRIDELGWVSPTEVPSRSETTRCPVWQALIGPNPRQGTVTTSTLDGSESPRLLVTAMPISAPDGSVQAVLASFVPATEDTDSTRDENTPFEYSLLAGLVVDESGRILDWNQRSLQLTGLDDEAMITRRFEDVCVLDTEWIWSSLDSAGGAPITGRTWVTYPNGDEIPVIGNFRLAADREHGRTIVIELLNPADFAPADQTPPGLIGRAGFDHSATAMLALTADGEIVEVNDQAAELLGWRPHALRQEPVSQFVAGLDEETLLHQAAAAGDSDRPIDIGPLDARRADGTEVQVTALMSALRIGVRWPILLLQLVPTS